MYVMLISVFFKYIYIYIYIKKINILKKLYKIIFKELFCCAWFGCPGGLTQPKQ